MDLNKLFQTKYYRPVHFTGERLYYWESDSTFDELLGKSDDELDCADFRLIFRRNASPATYEECAYFLPVALRFIMRNPEDAISCIEPIVIFVSINVPQLRSDGIYDLAVEAIATILSTWMDNFTVIHLDNDAMRALGSPLSHRDYVTRSQAVSHVLSAVLKNIEIKDSRWSFIAALAGTNIGPIHSAWALEVARQFREQECDVSVIGLKMFCDPEMIKRHVTLLKSSDLIDQLPQTYKQSLEIALGVSI